MPFGKPNTVLTFKSVKNAVKGDKLSLNQKIDFFFLFILLNSIAHFYKIYACRTVPLMGSEEMIL